MDKELLKNILTKEEFYENKLNTQQADNFIWTEDFAKKQLINLNCKYIKKIDGQNKKNLKEKIKTPDFIIGTNPTKIKLNTNQNNYFYVDVKEITGAMYSNFKEKNKILNPNPVEEMLRNLEKSEENKIEKILISEDDKNIMNMLLSQLKKIDYKYGEIRQSRKNGIIFVESPTVNEATFFHMLKLIEIIFSKVEKYKNIENLKYEILASQKNETIVISIPFKTVFNTNYLSFIAIFGSKRFNGLNLFFVNKDIINKYQNQKDFKWLINIIKKYNKT